jgi:hypothetical protein
MDWTDINPGLRSEKPATNNLSYGTDKTEKHTHTHTNKCKAVDIFYKNKDFEGQEKTYIEIT